MTRPRLLDLGCCTGSAGYGYELAGFDVTGMDIVPRPRHRGKFELGDALTCDLSGYQAVHWSAPCQRWCQATLSQRRKDPERYPDLITPMRPRLDEYADSGGIWIMENVPAAPLRADLELCGCMFGLELEAGTPPLRQMCQLLRPRAFEMSWQPELEPLAHDHRYPAISIAGHGTPAWQRRVTGHVRVAQWREVMGIDWPARREELTEAIPWAYTRYVGQLAMAVLGG